MKAGCRFILAATVFALLFSGTIFADSFTFTTLPISGDVSGFPGSTVGWGYSITNQCLSNWLVTTSIDSDLFSQGSPNVLFDFPIIAPGASVSQSFDSLAGIGLYELTWDVAAPVGFANVGTFIVSAEWWDGDPFDGGNFIDSADAQQSAYTATVTGNGGPTKVPEPGSILLLSIGCVMLGLKLKKNRRIQNQLS